MQTTTSDPTELTGLAGWVVDTIELLGPVGVGALVALETVFPPIPSEVVLPVAGFLAGQGRMSLVLAVVWATAGSVVGAYLLYWAGATVGHVRLRRLAERMPLTDGSDVDRSRDWFRRHGDVAVLVGRAVPVVRSLVSIPAGVAGMPLLRFGLYTFVGSALYNSALVGGGYLLGSRWTDVGRYSERINTVVVAAIVLAVVVFVVRRLRRPPPGAPPPEPGTRGQDPDRGARGPDRDVLELRIHGINNTAPPQMLDVAPADVEQVAGDALGGFWRPTDRALARLRPEQPGYVPDGVVREAYSWGGLARTTPRPGALAVASRAAGRIGWALLVPFGLVNVAFWSRPLSADGVRRSWQDGPTAAAVRLFAGGMTLLLLGTVAVVSLDLVATQCFTGGRMLCPRVLTPIAGLRAQPHGVRLAVLSLAPLGVLVLVALLGRATRTRYEQRVPVPVQVDGTGSPGAAGVQPDGRAGSPALLAAPGFWSNARLTATQSHMHVSGGLCSLVLATGWHQVLGTGPACDSAAELLGADRAGCAAQLAALGPTVVPFLLTVALALSGLTLVVVLLLRGDWGAVAEPAENRDGSVRERPWLTRVAPRLTVLSAVLLVAHTVALVVSGHRTSDEIALTGTAATPVLVVAVLLAVALWALRWRRSAPAGRHRAPGWGPTAPPAQQAWAGAAPGVLLLLALGLGLSLSTLLVVAAGDLLNGGHPAGDLVRAAADAAGPQQAIPTVYAWFGVVSLVGLGVITVVVVVGYVRTAKDLPPASAGAGAPGAASGPSGRSDDVVGSRRALAARRARRLAAWAHRAEPVVGVVAGTAALGVLAALVLAVRTFLLGGTQWPFPPADRASEPWPLRLWAWLVDVSAWGAGVTGLVVVVALAGGALVGTRRPLGLVWDLMGFLPRAGHPFGPPCYAERVVPELVGRYDHWLRGGARRRVVVSAHSLGAVLAVASILVATVELGRSTADRMGLLTYGSQLRPYFGRLFPELLGPDVLGVAPAIGADLLSPDPWAELVARDRRATPTDGVLRALLTGAGRVRWVNLWRRTDHLGFPADRYVGSDIDRPAQEVQVVGGVAVVLAHGGYTTGPAYRRALADLRRWSAGETAGAAGLPGRRPGPSA